MNGPEPRHPASSSTPVETAPSAPPKGMSLAEIQAVTGEIQAPLTGGVIQRVREPMPHHLALTVRAGGHNYELLIGVAPGAARIHLAKQLPATPPRPSPFSQRARKQLRPSRILSIAQLPEERVLRITVSVHRQEAGEWQAVLVAELFPRGRLLLLDEQQRLLAVTGPGGLRDLTIGQPYTPPAPSGHRAADTTVAGLPHMPLTSEQLEARYLDWHTRQQQQAQTTRVRLLRRRIERRIQAMTTDLARLQSWPRWQREGELLAAHRHLLQPGMSTVEVTDWFEEDCPTRTLSLNPALSPEAQINKCFQRAKKAQRGIPVIEQRLAAARQALTEPPEADAPTLPITAPNRRIKEAQQGIRRYAVTGQWQVWVGRNAAINDRLTFRLARGNDHWFHARQQAGAHVILRGSGDPPRQVILQAARLAAHFSRLKQAGGGEVIVTQRKYLRRPKGGKPGQVLVTQERGLQVSLIDTDMADLLATRLP